jgi:integrase/recombinase XerD
VISISDELRAALIEYRKTVPFAGPYVISTERALATSPQVIVNLFQR